MSEHHTLNEFVLLCRETPRVSQLWHNALDFFHARHIKMVSYHSDDAQRPGSRSLGIVADGFPDAWVCRYLEAELAKIDPIPELACKLTRPFRWSEAGQLAELTPEGARYLEILADSNLGDGLAMQVFGPNMRNAYVGLGFGENDPNLSAADIFELQCAAQIAHIRYCELTEHRQHKENNLSKREVEVLNWIARGKSNSVIADILGISRHTVDTITRRIFDKLDVNDRTTAAIRGVGSGVVSYRRGGVV